MVSLLQVHATNKKYIAEQTTIVQGKDTCLKINVPRFRSRASYSGITSAISNLHSCVQLQTI